MKKLYPLLVSGLCVIMLQSCSKDVAKPNPSTPSANAIDVLVAPNQVYQLNLTGSNTVSIFKQASHFQTSETIADAETGSVSYKYIPELNFSGKDQVVLSKTVAGTSTSSCSNSGCSQSGCQHNNNSGSENAYASSYTTYTTINITVSN